MCTRVPSTTITIMAGFHDHEFFGELTCGWLCSPTESTPSMRRARSDKIERSRGHRRMECARRQKPVLRFTQALNHGPPSCLRCVLDRREPLSQRPVQQGLRQTLAVGPDRLQPRTCKLGPHPRFGRTCRSGPASGAKAPRNPAPMVDARHRSTRRMGSGAGRRGIASAGFGADRSSL